MVKFSRITKTFCKHDKIIRYKKTDINCVLINNNIRINRKQNLPKSALVLVNSSWGQNAHKKCLQTCFEEQLRSFSLTFEK